MVLRELHSLTNDEARAIITADSSQATMGQC